MQRPTFEIEELDATPRRLRALVICAHLRPSRDRRRSRYMMQSIAGLQVASLIDKAHFDVELYHEDWHGPYDTGRCAGYDLVFLSGLQVDFDRMRQLSYHFRRHGARTVAGGSICTTFPDFAASFFDAVCVGGVDAVRDVVTDFRAGALKPIYRSPSLAIGRYVVDYGIFRESGIAPAVHLVEASRGCSFRCSFCVMPGEFGGHQPYRLDDVIASIDSAIVNSPRWSFSRNWPIVLFLDNNLSDDRNYLLAVCAAMRAHPKVRGWMALVTQNILQDRELVKKVAASKCVGLFAGIESLDPETLRRFRKTQNLSRRSNVIEDVAFAESLGVGIVYGLLFDPRHQTVAEMRRQFAAITDHPRMPMPVYLSVVAPLVGTAEFSGALARGELEPGLRLRDLDGETLCYRNSVATDEPLPAFLEQIFRRPWEVAHRRKVLWKTLTRIVRARRWNPIRWYIFAAATLHCYFWSRGTPAGVRTYMAGSDPLDPQYDDYPADISAADRARYFDPVEIVDAVGQPADWLRQDTRKRPRSHAVEDEVRHEL